MSGAFKKGEILRWLPVLLWAGLIFFGSTDTFSSSNTSRFIGPILRWLHPEISLETIQWFQFFIRKGWHVFEFFIITLLLWNALGWGTHSGTQPGSSWTRRRALLTWSGAVTYAMADEWHQSFRPTRGGTVTDVLIDSIGVTLAIGCIWLFYRWLNLRRRRATRGNEGEIVSRNVCQKGNSH